VLPLALTALAAGTSAAALLVLRRRRSRRLLAFGARVTPLPAGIQHLATTVTDLSDVGLHLPAARAAAGKPRLGSLLGLR
jgi:hypothetical protein